MDKEPLKPGLHLNTNNTCGWESKQNVCTFVHRSAFAEAANQPYINVLYANFFWCTDSRRIAFGYSPNTRRTAECCLPRLGNTSTLNDGFVFTCCIRFEFWCKPGFYTRQFGRSHAKECRRWDQVAAFVALTMHHKMEWVWEWQRGTSPPPHSIQCQGHLSRLKKYKPRICFDVIPFSVIVSAAASTCDEGKI